MRRGGAKIDGRRCWLVAAAGALFSIDTVASGHAALKHALQPYNRTLRLNTYSTIDDVVNRFDFIQSREYLHRYWRSSHPLVAYCGGPPCGNL